MMERSLIFILNHDSTDMWSFFIIHLWEQYPRLQAVLSRWYSDSMKLYRKTAHTIFDLNYHIVWTIKYRKPVLEGRLALRLGELIREICDTYQMQIIRGHVSKDHVHVFISMPPQISVSKTAQYMKGKTSWKLLIENPSLNKKFWGQHLWGQ